MQALVHQKKILVLILVKLRQTDLSLHFNGDNSYLSVNGKNL